MGAKPPQHEATDYRLRGFRPNMAERFLIESLATRRMSKGTAQEEAVHTQRVGRVGIAYRYVWPRNVTFLVETNINEICPEHLTI